MESWILLVCLLLAQHSVSFGPLSVRTIHKLKKEEWRFEKHLAKRSIPTTTAPLDNPSAKHCASIFKYSYCSNATLEINAGGSISELSSDWYQPPYFEISKYQRYFKNQFQPTQPCPAIAIIDKGCTLAACSSKSFETDCSLAQGNNGDNEAVYTYDSIGSVNCFCNHENEYPMTKQPSIPDTPGLCPHRIHMSSSKKPLCAIRYTGAFCSGNSTKFEDGLTLTNFGYYESNSWAGMISEPALKSKFSSIEINPNCTYIICTEESFNGDCKQFAGGENGTNYNTLPFDATFKSATCRCRAGLAYQIIETLRQQKTDKIVNEHSPNDKDYNTGNGASSSSHGRSGSSDYYTGQSRDTLRFSSTNNVSAPPVFTTIVLPMILMIFICAIIHCVVVRYRSRKCAKNGQDKDGADERLSQGNSS